MLDSLGTSFLRRQKAMRDQREENKKSKPEVVVVVVAASVVWGFLLEQRLQQSVASGRDWANQK